MQLLLAHENIVKYFLARLKLLDIKYKFIDLPWCSTSKSLKFLIVFQVELQCGPTQFRL